MRLVKQIVATLIVNFKVLAVDIVLSLSLPFVNLVEQVLKNSGNNASLIPVNATPRHCVGLTTAGLSIREDSPVVAVQEVND